MGFYKVNKNHASVGDTVLISQYIPDPLLDKGVVYQVTAERKEQKYIVVQYQGGPSLVVFDSEYVVIVELDGEGDTPLPFYPFYKNETNFEMVHEHFQVGDYVRVLSSLPLCSPYDMVYSERSGGGFVKVIFQLPSTSCQLEMHDGDIQVLSRDKISVEGYRCCVKKQVGEVLV